MDHTAVNYKQKRNGKIVDAASLGNNGWKGVMSERFDLQRFVDAQNYPQVVSELRTGRKQTHWMWFIFPQIVRLGHSPMALQYAIASRAEAQAYVIHPLLGERLSECARLINVIENKNIRHILGSPDDMKFRSSMTFFARVAKLPECSEAIKKYYPEGPDLAT